MVAARELEEGELEEGEITGDESEQVGPASMLSYAFSFKAVPEDNLPQNLPPHR